MKILHTADWHLGSFLGPESDGVNLRYMDIVKCLDEMVRVAKIERPELVLVSGDIFDKAEIWQGRSHREVLQARRVILELSQISQKVIVMRGTPNHDSMEAFEELQAHFEFNKNVEVCATPDVISTDHFDIAVLPGFDRGIFRAKFPGLSKEEENEVFTKELGNILLGLRAQCNSEKKSILMSHYTIPGSNTESGQTMMLTQFEPILPVEALKAADYDLVAMGHIHRPQVVQTVENCFYAGAINAMNFNDEGQERGFWIHHVEENAFGRSGLNFTDSQFYKTPYREFITLHLTDTDITAINHGNVDEVAMNYWRHNDAVREKIVRVHYNCSYENNKALNTVPLEKVLLSDGAFWVKEILPEKIEEAANREDMGSTTDPEKNLRKYLEEKQYPEETIQELILKARPVIMEAEASASMTAATGTFEPVEIEVKNYRNYAAEKFNFEDISFCTINGHNGAGKSSLFMDAIIDCLYEEPREGDLTGWIRNDEKARSGSIMFTFKIGDKTYRVTRTRARSGKGTLNLAELVDIDQFCGEWMDRSKEKYKDTQAEIINILGMDSLTFKSCALIMQDQYGLFLQAPKEDRMIILGNLLGLGIYQAMEKIVKDKAKESGAKTRDLKKEIELHTSTITGYGNPESELSVCNAQLKDYEQQLQLKTAERDKNKLLLSHQQEARERRENLLTSIQTLGAKKAAAEQNKKTQQDIIDSSLVILESKAEIEEKVAEYKTLLERELALAGESALYTSKKQEAENLAREAGIEQEAIATYKERVKRKEDELSWAQPTEQDVVVKEKAAEYERQKKLLDEAYEKERSYREVEQKLTQSKHSLQQLLSQYDASVQHMQLAEESLKKKADLLSNVECVDIDNAKCGFLADAISSKQALENYPEQYAEKKKAFEEQAMPINLQITEMEKQLSDMDFDIEEVAEISKIVCDLKPYVPQLEAINQREGKIALLEADIGHLQSNICEAEKRLAETKLKGTEAEQERDRYAKAFEEHGKVLSAIATLEPWIEREKQLPVAEERKETAANRIFELGVEIYNIENEITEKQEEADKEMQALNGIEELTARVALLNADVDSVNASIREIQMKTGALNQKISEIEKLRREISVLQEKETEAARETANYDILKVAFSQDGIPHQIVRSVIPSLSATANSILGQMTGGKMGIEFNTEKVLKSNSKKEVVTLDIFIEEYGKAPLPYLSKSGGEKVKASLSVILALAEIKSTSAGIQLGMLFIDEPPFLDSDGIQAYCDALETIQIRYENIKIMAITHDPTMKARFPQNLDVIKTENGSKIVQD
ncbi:metallophosphoesterase [Clostridiales Family XIII bacterium ASD5510]|uniref:Nuclease SbcCD subunit C n=2 Tax=Bacteria TaxID=2 RepID=A0A9J6QYE3_9FIRM|nr:AAA family ATPase [Hominibacterium faecale]MCU7380477.1 metallophosphoesterase [Hominibacterium faecale]